VQESTLQDAAVPHPVPFSEALRVWLKVALLSFGGPAGQISVMHRILVEEKRWISESQFLHALNYCMLLPGPEAQQLATYVGWLLHGTRGALVAGSLFVLPGFVAILLLSLLYGFYQDAPLLQAVFYGLKAAVLAVVIDAVVRIGRRVLKNLVLVAVASAAFVALFFFSVPFPAVIMIAAIAGLVGGRFWPDTFQVIKPHAAGDVEHRRQHTGVRSGLRRTLLVGAIGALLWFAPIVLLVVFLGEQHILIAQAEFFSKAAVVTFGGAYSVLAYIAQQAVEHYHWLTPAEMLNGLGMAETTPGPLIQVVQYVGFMGAFRDPAPFSPLAAGVLASVIVTWVTFVPCFIWILIGAPYVESMRDNVRLNAALSTITAAVVGVVLNLAVWFSLHVLFGSVSELRSGPLRLLIPDMQTLDGIALLIAMAALLMLRTTRLGLLKTLAISTITGALIFLVF